MQALSFIPAFDGAALLLSLLVTLAAFTVLWVASLRLNDAGIVDYYWGLGFPVIGWLTLFVAGDVSASSIAIASAATLWAARLSAHMITRHIAAGVEDPRYARMRAAGGPNFKQRSLFTVFWLQAVLMWLIAAPLHGAIGLAAPNALFWFGLMVFAFGFSIETIADWQLRRFKATPSAKGRLMTGGLFAWSRHPHYFGEITLWWGLTLAVFAVSGNPYVFFARPCLLWCC